MKRGFCFFIEEVTTMKFSDTIQKLLTNLRRINDREKYQKFAYNDNIQIKKNEYNKFYL